MAHKHTFLRRDVMHSTSFTTSTDTHQHQRQRTRSNEATSRKSEGNNKAEIKQKRSFTSNIQNESHKRVFRVINYGPITNIIRSPDLLLENIPEKDNQSSQHCDEEQPIVDMTITSLQNSTQQMFDKSQYTLVDEIGGFGNRKPVVLQKYATLDEDRTRTVVSKTEVEMPYVDPNSNMTNMKWPDRDEIQAVAKRGRLFAKRKINRLVSKDGNINLIKINVRRRSYLSDIFTTLLEVSWFYHLLLFGITFVTSWVAFALLWWLISVEHTDPQHVSDNGWKMCVDGVFDFTTALLFSIELQQTIGFGLRVVTNACPGAISLLVVQSLCGVMIQCVMAGLIFAKLARPKQRSLTINFSTRSVICFSNNCLFWQCRISDLRKSHMMAVDVRAIIIQRERLKDKDGYTFYQRDLKVFTELDSEYFFFAWPLKIVHHIDENSPLWNLSAESLLTSYFEIVVVFEGVSQETGMTTQVRTSYLPAEIAWGHTFAPIIIKRSNDSSSYLVDHSRFNDTVPLDMNENSAKENNECRLKAQLEC